MHFDETKYSFYSHIMSQYYTLADSILLYLHVQMIGHFSHSNLKTSLLKKHWVKNRHGSVKGQKRLFSEKYPLRFTWNGTIYSGYVEWGWGEISRFVIKKYTRVSLRCSAPLYLAKTKTPSYRPHPRPLSISRRRVPPKVKQYARARYVHIGFVCVVTIIVVLAFGPPSSSEKFRINHWRIHGFYGGTCVCFVFFFFTQASFLGNTSKVSQMAVRVHILATFTSITTT